MSCIKKTLALLLALALAAGALPALATRDAAYSSSPTSPMWEVYKPTLHYYYQQLNDREKQAFSRWYDAIAYGKAEWWGAADFGLTNDQQRRVQYAILFDCPELMFADTQLAQFWPNISLDAQWNLVFKNDALTVHANKIDDYWVNTKAVLERIKKRKDWGKTAYDHELAYDRYIVNNCSYQRDSVGKTNYDLRGAFSVFVFKKAVCEGYARATQLALRYFGIPCLYIYGTAGNESHAWNLVKLGKDWYHYDPTWQDAGTKRLFADYLPYFNVTDALIKRSHTIDREAQTEYGFDFPSCNATAFDYYKRNNKLLGADWQKKLPGIVKKAKSTGKQYVAVRFTSEKLLKAAYRYVNRGRMRFHFRYYYYSPFTESLLLYFAFKK